MIASASHHPVSKEDLLVHGSGPSRHLVTTIWEILSQLSPVIPQDCDRYCWKYGMICSLNWIFKMVNQTILFFLHQSKFFFIDSTSYKNKTQFKNRVGFLLVLLLSLLCFLYPTFLPSAVYQWFHDYSLPFTLILYTFGRICLFNLLCIDESISYAKILYLQKQFQCWLNNYVN